MRVGVAVLTVCLTSAWATDVRMRLAELAE